MATLESKVPSADLVDRFHDFLRGAEPPDGITLSKRPRKMTAEQSMAVIYVLQEFLHVIPDHYEMCTYCGRIFDTESEGHIGSEGQDYCENCSYLCRCSECRKR